MLAIAAERALYPDPLAASRSRLFPVADEQPRRPDPDVCLTSVAEARRVSHASGFDNHTSEMTRGDVGTGLLGRVRRRL